MVSTLDIVICAAVATLFWTGLGLVLARRLVPAPLAPAFAPALGFATHGALALPIFLLVRFSAVSVVLVGVTTFAAAVAMARATRPPAGPAATRESPSPVHVPPLAWLAAALLAIVPAIALAPKQLGDAVILAEQMFDHSKIAMIDDMVKFGLPAGNPFIGGSAAQAPLAYYYLWHFGAAQLAATCAATGWEADIALTWFTAFASLALMMGLAVWCSGRAAAATWVVALCAAASARPWLDWAFGHERVDGILPQAGGFAGWLFQSAWTPQHLASASCVVLALVLMCRLVERASAWLVVVLALVIAAGVESSTWVGGVTFAVAALPVAIAVAWRTDPKDRWRFLARLAVAGGGAVALALPLLRDQIVATSLRGGGAPIVLEPFAVLGNTVPQRWRAILDWPAYWLLLLPVELPAIYATGPIAWAKLATSRTLAPEVARFVAAGGALAGAGLAVSWLLASVIGDNDDLGWRAILPVIMVMTAFAAAGLARWIAERSRWLAAAAIGAVLLALPASYALLRGNVTGNFQLEGRIFAEMPQVWAAVRAQSAADERVGNNPLFLQHLTPWPANLSWALLADRRSCFAGRELALAFAPIPAQQREEIDAQFIRLFDGRGTPDDVHALATIYDCRLIVLTPSDGAWARDPFAGSGDYRLIDEKPDQWRIYRRIGDGDASP